MASDVRPFTYGYVPDPPDDSDEDFSGALSQRLVVASDEGNVDLSPHATGTNQYWAGSCVGNATADSVEVLNSLQGRPVPQLSRLFVYAMARSYSDFDHDGRADYNLDEGTHIRLAFRAIKEYGICTEKTWPYDLDKNLLRRPSLRAMREATAHHIQGAYRITETGDARCEAVLRALRAKHPVVFGTTISQSLGSLNDAGPVGIPSDPGGGHAMLILGYRADKGFLVKNSWGSGWGENGYFYMTPEYLTWGQTHDLWVPTLGTDF